jgi:hypothetical protein
MASWDDVVAIGRKLPETKEDLWYGTPSLKVGGKGFCRLRTEAEGGLVVFCDLETKEALLDSSDPAFYTTPHYDGYGAIIVNLRLINRSRLSALLTESWHIKAPAKVRRMLDRKD